MTTSMKHTARRALPVPAAAESSQRTPLQALAAQQTWPLSQRASGPQPPTPGRRQRPLVQASGELHNAVRGSGPLVLWYENTPSVKPEVHNISQLHQRRTKLWSPATCTKIGKVRPCGFRVMRADRQTHKQTMAYSSQYFATLPGRNNNNVL